MAPMASFDFSEHHATPPTSAVAPLLQDPAISQLFALSGRTAVVTGAARGLGITLAAALLEAGAHVYCLDILPEPSPKEWAALVVKSKEHNLTVNYRQVDITKSDMVKSVFESIAAEAPCPVRVLVAAAGVQQECPAIDFKTEDMRRIMDINVVGSFNTAQAAAITMFKHGLGGSIVMIASMSGTVANKGLFCTPYNSSKAAVLQMCRSLSMEWAGNGVRVNTISPGYIKTAMTEMLLAAKPELGKQWADDNPLHRISLPWEYKGSVIFLASDASSFCTGSDLRVDGGHCAW